MSRMAFALCVSSSLSLALSLVACLRPPVGVAQIGLSAGGTASTAPAAEPPPPPPPAEASPPATAPARAGGPAPVAADEALAIPSSSAPLAAGGEVSGTLAPEGLRRFPFTVAKGRYLVELFVRAPERQCSGQPAVDATVIDRDEARVGSTFGAGTWQHDSWEKQTATFDLQRGPYQVSVLARKGCTVHFRVRLSVAP